MVCSWSSGRSKLEVLLWRLELAGSVLAGMKNSVCRYGHLQINVMCCIL